MDSQPHGLNQPHSPGRTRVQLSSFFFQILINFSYFSSNFPHFLPHFGPPGGRPPPTRMVGGGCPWLCHCPTHILPTQVCIQILLIGYLEALHNEYHCGYCKFKYTTKLLFHQSHRHSTTHSDWTVMV